MAIIVEDRGRGNVISLPDAFVANSKGIFKVTGDNNRVTVGEGCVARNLNVQLGGNCRLSIGRQANLGGLHVYMRGGSTLSIGDFTGFTAHCDIQAHEASSITIGEHCIVASHVWMSVSDMHPIYDRTTNERLNPAEPIRIGDKVWVGHRASLLKGSVLEDGAVIGACAVVTGRVPACCVAAGTPARVVRENVRWELILPQD